MIAVVVVKRAGKNFLTSPEAMRSEIYLIGRQFDLFKEEKKNVLKGKKENSSGKYDDFTCESLIKIIQINI
jgi:hypothetical protein